MLHPTEGKEGGRAGGREGRKRGEERGKVAAWLLSFYRMPRGSHGQDCERRGREEGREGGREGRREGGREGGRADRSKP
jgi:hypothetical protein